MTAEMINGIVLGSMVTIPICILFWLLLMFYRGWSNLWNKKYIKLCEPLKSTIDLTTLSKKE